MYKQLRRFETLPDIVWRSTTVYSNLEMAEIVKFVQSVAASKKSDHLQFKVDKFNERLFGDDCEKYVSCAMIKAISYSIASGKNYATDKKLQNMGGDIVDQYNSSSLEEIVNKYNLTPYRTLCHILREKGYSNGYINEIFQNPEIVLDDKIKSDIHYVYNHDLITPSNNEQYLQDLKDFEKKVANYIRNYWDISFKTEEELVIEQQLRYGKPAATPDILFDTPITIRVGNIQKTVNWLDVKNYALINLDSMIEIIRKQIKKYNEIYGEGAIVFRYGYCLCINIKGVLLLNGSFLNDSKTTILIKENF